MAPVATLLPSFFVVGAAKSGTTSLHLYLGEHPEVEMSAVKEPQVFAADDYGRRLAEYAGLFPGQATLRGESSAVYSQYPRWPGVPERILEHVPDARFVYLVRDPIERALAHYAQHVADGKERRAAAEAFADWSRADSLYVCPSRYATQLGRYLEHFEAERILVVDQADLLERREGTLARVFEFLGADPGFSSARFDERMNTRDVKRSDTALGRQMRSTGTFGRVRRLPIPGAARRKLRRLVSRPLERPELDPGLREQIADSLHDEVAWLRSHTGESLASWSV